MRCILNTGFFDFYRLRYTFESPFQWKTKLLKIQSRNIARLAYIVFVARSLNIYYVTDAEQVSPSSFNEKAKRQSVEVIIQTAQRTVCYHEQTADQTEIAQSGLL